VAAVLFKVEHAWKRGLTAHSKTSRSNEWASAGTTSKKLEPKMVQDMALKKLITESLVRFSHEVGYYIFVMCEKIASCIQMEIIFGQQNIFHMFPTYCCRYQ
jgi:hypothetical protein